MLKSDPTESGANDPTSIILITGHSGSGKTTLAHILADELGLPLFYKDQIKETLMDALGSTPSDWSRQLGMVTWTLLYQQIESLLKTGVSHIVEGNFDPQYATDHWRSIMAKYPIHLIQVRCQTDPAVLLKRYRWRIQTGERHSGHLDQSDDSWFINMIQQPMGWIDVKSDRIPVDTSTFSIADYPQIAEQIRCLDTYIEE